jgi:hypothetical protein
MPRNVRPSTSVSTYNSRSAGSRRVGILEGRTTRSTSSAGVREPGHARRAVVRCLDHRRPARDAPRRAPTTAATAAARRRRPCAARPGARRRARAPRAPACRVPPQGEGGPLEFVDRPEAIEQGALLEVRGAARGECGRHAFTAMPTHRHRRRRHSLGDQSSGWYPRLGPSQRSAWASVQPLRSAYSATWSRPSAADDEVLAVGCAKYHPDTEAPGPHRHRLGEPMPVALLDVEQLPQRSPSRCGPGRPGSPAPAGCPRSARR